MKKFLCVILSLVLALMTFMPDLALAMEIDVDEEATDDREREIERHQEIWLEWSGKERIRHISSSSQEVYNTFHASEEIRTLKTLSENAESHIVSTEELKAIQTMYSLGKALVSAVGSIGTIISYFNTVRTLLKQLGIIKDNTITKDDLILQATQHLEEQVGVINEKLDQVATTMAKNHAEIMTELRRIEFNNYKSLWTEFVKTVQALRGKQTELQNTVRSILFKYASAWQKGPAAPLRILYGYVNEQGKIPKEGESRKLSVIMAEGNMAAPGEKSDIQPTQSKDGIPVAFSVTIPGLALYSYIDRNTTVNADNYEKIMSGAIRESLSHSGIVEFMSDGGKAVGWNKMTQKEQEEYAEKLVSDAEDTLAYAAMYHALDGNNGKLYSEFMAAYDDFCDFVTGEHQLTTPMEAEHKMLTMTHAFEGEVINEEQMIRSYLTVLCDTYGVLAVTLSEFSSLASAQDVKNVQEKWRRTFNSVVLASSDFITGNDNYCYLVNAPIEYHDVTIRSTFGVGKELPSYKDGSLSDVYLETDQDFYQSGMVSSQNWVLYDETRVYPAETDSNYDAAVLEAQTEILGNLLTGSQLAELYAICDSLYGPAGYGNFYKYLRAYGAYVPGTVKSASFANHYGMRDTVITGINYTRDAQTGRLTTLGRSLNLGAKTKMKMWSVRKALFPKDLASDNEWRIFRDQKSYPVSDGKVRDSDYRLHDHVEGDTFNLSDGSLASGLNLVSRAIYGDDEIVMLCTDAADVTRVVTHDAPKALSGDVYRTRYHVSLNVSRPMAVIMKTAEKKEEGIAASYTVPNGVTSLGAYGLAYSGMINISKLTLPDMLKNEEIHKSAFQGLGSPERRVLLRTGKENLPKPDELLLTRWKGGWFGDALVNLDVSNGDEKLVFHQAVVSGSDIHDIKLPYEIENWSNGRKLAGWSTVKGALTASTNIIAKDGLTLYAVWAYDHEHDIETVFEDAACTREGLFGKSYCTVCGMIIDKGTVEPALGHDFGIAVSDLNGNPATFDKTCLRCGETHTFKKLQFVSLPYYIYADVTAAGTDVDLIQIDNGAVTVTTDATLIFSNKDPKTPATASIYVPKGVMGNLVLCNVNIDTHAGTKPAVTTELGSKGINIVLAGGSVNSLYSGSNTGNTKGTEYYAGLNGTPGATLRISGSGKLTAQSRKGAGIGGSGANVIIEDGDITAIGYGGAGIGANRYSDIGTITINGGTVNASVRYERNTGYSSAVGASDGDLGDITINGGRVHAEVKNYTSTVIGPDPQYQSTPISIRITGGTVEAVNKDSVLLASVIGGDGGQVDGVYITGGVVSALTEADTKNVGAPPIAARNGSVLISEYASVKMPKTDLQENYGINDVPVHNMLGEEAVEYVIENPDGETITVNDHEFPYKDHLGEKRVYVYMPARMPFIGIPQYTVTFMMNLPDEPGEYTAQYVQENTCAVRPDDPTSLQGSFVGWALDPDGKQSYDFSSPVTEDITLYAVWKLNGYRIILGAEQTVWRNAEKAVFASDAEHSKFVRLEVDGRTVSEKNNYTHESGSTVITLLKAFIGTLSLGEHTLRIVSSDGSAATTFTVVSSSPDTGDRFPTEAVGALLVLAAGAMLILQERRRRLNAGK